MTKLAALWVPSLLVGCAAEPRLVGTPTLSLSSFVADADRLQGVARDPLGDLHVLVEGRGLLQLDDAGTLVTERSVGDKGLEDRPYRDVAVIGDGRFLFIADNEGCVIGGTAWDFANASRVPPASLDLLVIEEAGQFCLANTIAVAQAATNLLLLGDPQHLPQVSQGTHPEPVDASALGWLVDGHHTLPEELGYFLDRSYRMHPAVCAAVFICTSSMPPTSG